VIVATRCCAPRPREPAVAPRRGRMETRPLDPPALSANPLRQDPHAQCLRPQTKQARKKKLSSQPSYSFVDFPDRGSTRCCLALILGYELRMLRRRDGSLLRCGGAIAPTIVGWAARPNERAVERSYCFGLMPSACAMVAILARCSPIDAASSAWSPGLGTCGTGERGRDFGTRRDRSGHMTKVEIIDQNRPTPWHC